MSNPVNPDHYLDKDSSGIACHMAQRAALGPKGYQDYLVGCAIKYLWRWRQKNGEQDLKKSKQCIEMVLADIALLEEVETIPFGTL